VVTRLHTIRRARAHAATGTIREATQAPHMLDIEFEVCTDCGNLHLEGGPGPRDVEECAACGGRVTGVELEDVIGL